MKFPKKAALSVLLGVGVVLLPLTIFGLAVYYIWPEKQIARLRRISAKRSFLFV